MTLLVPTLLITLLVLGWIVWLAVGFSPTSTAPNFFASTGSKDDSYAGGDSSSTGTESIPMGVEEAEHLRTRLDYPKVSGGTLTGNALHVECRSSGLADPSPEPRPHPSPHRLRID